MQIQHTDFQDQLVRGLAHRMNNILTLFHGYIGLLLDNQGLDTESRDGLAKIKDGAKAAADLMDRTHSLVRPSTVVWREVNVGDFVRMLRPGFDTLRGPNTELVFDIPAGLPPILADAGRVKTAIVELVRNALDATFAGGHVNVSLRLEKHGTAAAGKGTSNWLVVSVADDGPGIPEEIGERVFDPFFTTKKKQHAAGLGLTVALAFAQQHKGQIHFESQPGSTKFELLLPAQAEE